MRFYSLISGMAVLGMIGSAAAADLDHTSVLVCRAKQCAKAEYSMTREFLYNKLVQLFEKNLNKDVYLCEADPISHVCYNPAIVIPARTSLVSADVVIPSARVLDAKMVNNQVLDVIFDYTVDINSLRSVCQSSRSRLKVDYVDKVQMISPAFECRFTETGSSEVNMSYNIDYVDFDYGTLGAYYSAGIGSTVQGGASGYVLMRFAEKQDATTKEYNLIDKAG